MSNMLLEKYLKWKQKIQESKSKTMMELLVNVKCNTLEAKILFVGMRLLITDSSNHFYESSSRLIAENVFVQSYKKS